MITIAVDSTLINIEYSDGWEGNPQSDFDTLFGQEFAEFTIKLDGRVLKLMRYDSKISEYEFILNYEKVIKDKESLGYFLSEYNLHYEIEKRARNSINNL